MTIEELRQEIRNRNLPADDSAVEAMLRLTAILKEWNGRFNLTAIDEPEEVYEKHLLDCLIPLSHIHPEGSVCDVGSGAGFPGLVWAAALPEVSFTLLEPTQKRCRFLEAAAEEMGLKNVTVVNQRAEEFAAASRESFDTVTARAVANLPVLSELCVPLVRTGGTFAAMKGSHGTEEAEEAAYALKTLGCQEYRLFEDTLPNGEKRVLVTAVKQKPTDRKYPRAYAKIKQKPLMEKHGYGKIHI